MIVALVKSGGEHFLPSKCVKPISDVCSTETAKTWWSFFFQVGRRVLLIVHLMWSTSSLLFLCFRCLHDPVFEYPPNGQNLANVFSSMLAPDRPASERRVALTVFDDMIEYSGEFGLRYIPRLLPAMKAYATDENPEVKLAAAYGLGIAAEKGGEIFARYVHNAHRSGTTRRRGIESRVSLLLGTLVEYQTH